VQTDIPAAAVAVCCGDVEEVQAWVSYIDERARVNGVEGFIQGNCKTAVTMTVTV
jgi:hypothetical protein